MESQLREGDESHKEALKALQASHEVPLNLLLNPDALHQEQHESAMEQLARDAEDQARMFEEEKALLVRRVRLWTSISVRLIQVSDGSIGNSEPRAAAGFGGRGCEATGGNGAIDCLSLMI